ncbi:MAG: hypothetical protein KTR31_10035 [Myxococcales bacterium]|nr:hypothetical protein [Myxococcales bacterium]
MSVVPIQLGCCHEPQRCLLCPPPPPPPTAELVSALVQHYQERSSELRAGFYGGPPPTDELLEALGGLPFVARVRPDLLSRADAKRLKEAGAIGIELDLLSLSDHALRQVRRPHRRRLVLEQLEGLRAMGLRTGAVLAPGLPGTDHEGMLADATELARQVDFARLHPVLVLADSGLREVHMDGRYRPLDLGAAITICRALLDLLEGAGVTVIRIGQNPGPDGLGRAVGGPRHSALRQLVEARRTLDTLQSRLSGIAAGSRVAIRCHPADETRTRGPYNQHIRTLRAQHSLARLKVRPDPDLKRGEFVLEHEG